MNPQNIIIVEDHPLVRLGIRTIITAAPQYNLIGEFGRGDDLLKFIKNQSPQIILFDLSLPDTDGFKLFEKVKKKLPDCLTMAISMHSSREYVEKAVRIGMNGFISKESTHDLLLKGLDTIAVKGQMFFEPWFSPSEVKQILWNEKNHPIPQRLTYSDLTPREQELFCEMAEGLPINDIAKKFYISPKTVINHRTNIMKKLDIHSKLDLFRYAVKLGVVEVCCAR